MSDPTCTSAAARVLVVGHGFIGSAAVRSLIARGYGVTVLTRNVVPAATTLEAHDVRIVVGGAEDPAARALALDGVGTVVYCAGTPLPAAVEGDGGAVGRLVAPVEAMAVAAAAVGVRRLLFLSSGGTVYGEPDTNPVAEHHPLRPMHTYAVANASAEEALASVRSTTGLETSSIRCANPYGEGQLPWRGQGIVATLFAAAASGQAVPLFGDGAAIRDYIHVADVGDAIADLVGCPALPAAVNVGTGVGTELLELVRQVESACGRAIRLERRPARPTDLRRVVLDVSLLRSLVPFEPVDLATGLARVQADPVLVSASE